MALRLVAGTIEYVLVDLVDRTGAITDLTSLSPKYNLFKPDGVTHVYTDATASISTFATGTLTSDTTNVSNNDTVTIGGMTYTFKTALTPAAYEVLIGATYTDSLLNLKAAINLESGAGTLYGAATVVHPTVKASGAGTPTLTITAKTAGTSGNAITSTENSTHLSFGGATLSGGSGPDGTLTFICLIDTTVGNPTGVALVKGSTYTLYVKFTNGSEVPQLGPVEIQIV